MGEIFGFFEPLGKAEPHSRAMGREINQMKQTFAVRATHTIRVRAKRLADIIQTEKNRTKTSMKN